MATETVPYGRKTQKPPAVSEVHIVWITAGLGCDGDSVSITAATQPSIEDVLLGAIPGLPKVHLHNPVLAYENGDDFLKYWYLAEEGKLDPFVSGGGRIDPEREDQEEKDTGRHWEPTPRPISRLPRTNGSIASRPRQPRSSPAALARLTAAFTRWKEIRPVPWAWRIISGWQWTSKAGSADRECSRMPGAAGQLHGDCALPALPGGGARTHDSAG